MTLVMLILKRVCEDHQNNMILKIDILQHAKIRNTLVNQYNCFQNLSCSERKTITLLQLWQYCSPYKMKVKGTIAKVRITTQKKSLVKQILLPYLPRNLENCCFGSSYCSWLLFSADL
ncbi:hypothetical protein KIL84_001069 [Mauremys mutica]|uniref:Uncharacterized protein n=1 Tax=Mauremys mutica TaxID=74926 RepID=A0A9D4ATR5_9SAUR|nr:hypothetical protein KIL84_001069 [Mauremys mutica]